MENEKWKSYSEKSAPYGSSRLNTHQRLLSIR
jgi:hypothetical protein